MTGAHLRETLITAICRRFIYYLFWTLLITLNCPQSRGQKEATLNKYIEGVTGETLTLPCQAKPPTADRVSLVLWYRDHHSDAVFTYDAREGSNDLQQTGPLKGRASFHIGPHPHLTLRHIAVEDGGIYECRVDFLKAPSQTTLLKVYVVEPPTNIVIKEESGKVVPNTITANAGAELRLICVVSGGFPKPEIWWTLNGQEIDATWEEAEGDRTQNEVALPPLQRLLHYSKLACHASNTNVTEAFSQEVTLLLNTPPSAVTISSVAKELHSGRTYRALCSVEGSRPAPIIIWRIIPAVGRSKILNKSDMRTSNQSQTWLEFKVDYTLDKATLSCSAMSPALPEALVTNITSLNVVFAPRLSLSLGKPLTANSIKEGIDVYFTCRILANPPVSKMEWFINNKSVVHNPGGGVVVSNDHLVLQRINRKWSGDFSCWASNKISATSSSILGIVVQYSPVCSQSGIVVRAGLEQDVSVPCRVTANPSNVSFSWTFSQSTNQKQNMSEEKISWKGMESRLKYRPEKVDDYGTLYCWGQNSVGRQKVPCKISVKAAGSPPPPVNCSVSNQTWESLEVTCGYAHGRELSLVIQNEEGKHEPLQQGGHQQIQEDQYSAGVYHLELGASNGPADGEEFAEVAFDSDQPKYLLTVRERVSRALVYNLTGVGRVFSVSGLTPGLDYAITISTFNSHGRSSEVVLEALTLRMAENRMRKKEQGQDSAILGAVMGALGLVFVVGVAIVVLALRCRKSQARNPNDVTVPSSIANDDFAEGQKVDADGKMLNEATLLLDPKRGADDGCFETSSRRFETSQPDLLGSRDPQAQNSKDHYKRTNYLDKVISNNHRIHHPDEEYSSRSTGVRFSSPTHSGSSRTSSPIDRIPVLSPGPIDRIPGRKSYSQSTNKQLYVRVDRVDRTERESFL